MEWKGIEGIGEFGYTLPYKGAGMRRTVEDVAQSEAGARFGSVRRRTLELCKPLTAEDMMVQSCPEASPAKWHLAHTAWFFESFILREFLGGYRVFNEDFA